MAVDRRRRNGKEEAEGSIRWPSLVRDIGLLEIVIDLHMLIILPVISALKIVFYAAWAAHVLEACYADHDFESGIFTWGRGCPGKSTNLVDIIRWRFKEQQRIVGMENSPSSRVGQTSALLDRISRLQSRLNERVALAGLSHSMTAEKRSQDRSPASTPNKYSPARPLSSPTRSGMRGTPPSNTPGTNRPSVILPPVPEPTDVENLSPSGVKTFTSDNAHTLWNAQDSVHLRKQLAEALQMKADSERALSTLSERIAVLESSQAQARQQQSTGGDMSPPPLPTSSRRQIAFAEGGGGTSGGSESSRLAIPQGAGAGSGGTGEVLRLLALLEERDRQLEDARAKLQQGQQVTKSGLDVASRQLADTEAQLRYREEEVKILRGDIDEKKDKIRRLESTIRAFGDLEGQRGNKGLDARDRRIDELEAQCLRDSAALKAQENLLLEAERALEPIMDRAKFLQEALKYVYDGVFDAVKDVGINPELGKVGEQEGTGGVSLELATCWCEDTVMAVKDAVVKLRGDVRAKEKQRGAAAEDGNAKGSDMGTVRDLRVQELEAEVGLLKGRIKALNHQIERKSYSNPANTPTTTANEWMGEDNAVDARDEIPLEEITVTDPLGKGAFAEVHMGWWRRPVAVKRFTNVNKQDHLDAFDRESRILKPLNHVGIAKFYGVCTHLPDMDIIQECVIGTSVHNLCHNRDGLPWPTDEILGIALQLAEAMAYVHSRGVVHRDVKPTNILVSEGGIVKLIDFGLACSGDFHRMPKKHTGAGTPVYLPPEVLREEAGSLTPKVDVYSFGLVLWEMLSQTLPWENYTLAQMYAAVCTRDERPPIPRDASHEVATIIQASWHANPCERPDFIVLVELLKEAGAPLGPIMHKAQHHTILAM